MTIHILPNTGMLYTVGKLLNWTWRIWRHGVRPYWGIYGILCSIFCYDACPKSVDKINTQNDKSPVPDWVPPRPGWNSSLPRRLADCQGRRPSRCPHLCWVVSHSLTAYALLKTTFDQCNAKTGLVPKEGSPPRANQGVHLDPGVLLL